MTIVGTMQINNSISQLGRILYKELTGYYKEMMGNSVSGVFKAILTNDPILKIIHWQFNSRMADFFIWKAKQTRFARIPQWYFILRRNTLGNRIGIEINTMLIDEGFCYTILVVLSLMVVQRLVKIVICMVITAWAMLAHII